MFDVGFAELFMLSLIGLLVLGPERLPAVARTLGSFVRKARLSYNNLKRTVEAELAAADAANPIKQARDELDSVQKQVAEIGKQLDERVEAPVMAPTEKQHPLNPELPQPPDAPSETTAPATAGSLEDPARADSAEAPEADDSAESQKGPGEQKPPRAAP